MADLSERDRRGQILLVTGFALAVAFVGLALVLNSVIYTENLATRSESTTSEPITHARALERGTVDVLRYVNTHNASIGVTHAQLRDNLSRGIANVSDVSARHQLADGQVADDQLVGDVDGTLLAQTNASRDFTNRNGATQWSPVNDSANGAHSLRVHVSDAAPLTTGSRFTVTASDGTDTWQLAVGADDIEVTDAGGTPTTWATPADPFWINVSRGTLNGTAVDGLDFGGGLDTIDRVTFANADNVQGTFALTVNKTAAVDDEGVDYAADADGPFTAPAIFGAVVEVDFERRNLVYRTDLRVIPGEDDD